MAAIVSSVVLAIIVLVVLSIDYSLKDRNDNQIDHSIEERNDEKSVE